MRDLLFETKNPLYICDTILRDAQQSHAAARMRLEDMLPACKALDNIGYWSLECWGGATFDACLRFLQEDPWERLRALRKALPNTRLQMLLRGRNLLGYRPYADDVIDAFCERSIANGIDVVRIFDALNDVRNMETSMRSVKKYGGTVEAALSYTKSPVHNEDYFVEKAVLLEQMGADIICIKDMANLLLPVEAYSLVKRLREKLSVPIHLHTHNTAGTGAMVCFAAAMAGVDIVDCALSPFADGTSQPATESIAAAMRDTPRDTGLDLQKLNIAAGHFREVAGNMEREGIIDPKVLRVDAQAFSYQVPGGMLSSLISQLKEADAEERLEEVLREIPRVREDFGYPPLVTPASQIVGTQAVLNVLTGRYEVLTRETKALLRGEYGELPGKINGELRSMAAVHVRNEDSCEKAAVKASDASYICLGTEMDHIKTQYGDVARTEEDLLSCAMFPRIAPDFIRRRDDLIVHEISVEWDR